METGSTARTDKRIVRGLVFLAALFLLLAAASVQAKAAAFPGVNISVSGTDEPAAVTSTLQLMLVLALLSIAPFALLMLTSFTRILISLHFIRAALGTQQMPPNQILIGIALFLTLFIMSPVVSEINENAVQPYVAGQITSQEAFEAAGAPLKKFMASQTRKEDAALFANLSKTPVSVNDYNELPFQVLIPAFIVGEITKGFILGFIIYIPFIVIDMVVASILMAMGMMMLPPAMISMPFKILLFIMVDGWNVIMRLLVETF